MALTDWAEHVARWTLLTERAEHVVAARQYELSMVLAGPFLHMG